MLHISTVSLHAVEWQWSVIPVRKMESSITLSLQMIVICQALSLVNKTPRNTSLIEKIVTVSYHPPQPQPPFLFYKFDAAYK